MRICRESLLTKAHGRSCCGRKGASAPFSCLPARTGSGRARKQVKGLVPCGFSGQRPEPSESFLMLRSAIFKVLLSLFFSARFFIDHLTLPRSSSSFYLQYTCFSAISQAGSLLRMCQVIVGTFSSFFDISLFLLFSDNSARTLSDHFMFLFNRMLLQGLSSMLSALRPIAAYDA